MSDMSRTEALKILKSAQTDKYYGTSEQLCEAWNMAIASLETDEAYQLEYEQPELCKNCISRKAVLHTLDSMDSALDENRTVETYKDLLKECYKVLPSVTPQEPRKGHWIEHDWKEMRERGYYRCSVCNCGYQRYTKGIRKSDVPYIDGQEYILWNCDNYCPNCGCRMVEPQKSEDKE